MADAIKELRFEVNVDESGVARRLFAEAEFDVPEDADAGALEGGKVSVSIRAREGGRGPEDRGARQTPSPWACCSGSSALGSGLSLPQRQ